MKNTENNKIKKQKTMHSPDKISGTVERFLFQNEENGFVVFVLSSPTISTVVKGSLPPMQTGQEVELEGSWVFHKKFGKQFHAENCITKVPTTITGLRKYLGSGLIRGIGKVYAEKIVNHFGLDVLDVIDREPQRLKEVDGIGEKRIATIMEAWKEQKEIANIMVFLQEKDISPAYSIKIYRRYRENSIAVLHENPYKLADDIWGIGFAIADKIARNLGFEKNSPQRITAGIVFSLKEATSSGHLYLELEKLKKDSAELLELQDNARQLIKNALHSLYEEERIKLVSVENTHFIGLAEHYFTEKGISSRILSLKKHKASKNFDLDKIYQNLRTSSDGDHILNEKQQEGIMLALQKKVTVITGGPGTGKTTMIKSLLSILDSEGASYKLAAPTGRAAKRIMESTGRYATTIHRLLEFDVGKMRFLRNESNALKLDYLIVDEASMIDVFLAYSILRAVPLNARIIFIGDIDQLPSVGPGNFLKDIIESGKTISVHLKEIFRQAKDSLIIVNAHRVNSGEFPISSLQNSLNDFRYVKETDPEKIIEHLKHILFVTIKKYGINLEDVQIIVPMNRGTVGTQNLNRELQTLLNPSDRPHINSFGFKYKEGDKVMQIKNNYDKKIFNGDIGIIEQVNNEEKKLHVIFGNREIIYDANELSELVLAYAITIHKSQGSEYNSVVIPLFIQHFALLQRNLLYTAITRAKNLCILIGEPRAIGMAIKNNKTTKRITFLKSFLNNEIN